MSWRHLRVRGADRQTAAMFSYISPEGLMPQNHPLRAIRPLVNAALQRLSPEFDKIYAPGGRESIAPERLLRGKRKPVATVDACVFRQP